MSRTKAQRGAAIRSAEKAEYRAKRAAAKRQIPPPPDTLGPAGLRIWESTWRHCPWLGPSHLPVVERYAELADERAALRAELARTGLVVQGSRKQPVLNPLVRALRLCESMLGQIEHELGLAVSSARAACVADEVAVEEERERAVAEPSSGALTVADVIARKEMPQ